MMPDWNDYRASLLARVQEFGALTPETLKGYAALGQAGRKTQRLDPATRELIGLAVAVALRCDGCIATHAAEAKRLGVGQEELAEALGVAISISAGAALVYSARTLDAFETSTSVPSI